MAAQLEMFATEPSADGGLIGLKVKLDRPADREQPCCCNIGIIADGNEINCADCGHRRSRLSPTTAQWIQSVASRFGAPTTPIIVRKSNIEE